MKHSQVPRHSSPDPPEALDDGEVKLSIVELSNKELVNFSATFSDVGAVLSHRGLVDISSLEFGIALKSANRGCRAMKGLYPCSFDDGERGSSLLAFVAAPGLKSED